MSLNRNIRNFYDASSPVWLEQWGEHMHHGYYGADGKSRPGRAQAQIDMIEALLGWSGVQQAENMIDLGCGVGGSSRYLSNKFGAKARGITLSPVQAEWGNNHNSKLGISDRVNIEVGDMLELDTGDSPYDLVWSMESAEHIPDKRKLFRICHELLAPGGDLIMATWCHRRIPPGLSKKERNILDGICRLYHLPALCTIDALEAYAREAGFTEIKTGDWSLAVSPFWREVIHSAFTWNSIRGLMKAGWGTIKGAWAMQYMQRGFSMGLIKFGVLHAKK
jgi:tocopherol O-methyltransferase